jgi:hypothetical protein
MAGKTSIRGKSGLTQRKRWGDASSTPWSQDWFGRNVFGPYFVPVIGANGVGVHMTWGHTPSGWFPLSSTYYNCFILMYQNEQ